ncbi:bcl-2-related ovarian killer protein-like isoform X2 [Palaemon carinicauda]|uniref:bcl-2-related ovarian killer protein-like isoform X2 n=1 Tax=Palaemon carinicauda TaxID=392227 RepID=UPI0035B65320
MKSSSPKLLRRDLPPPSLAMSSHTFESFGSVGVGAGMSMGISGGGPASMRMRKTSVPIMSSRSLEIPGGPMHPRSLSRSGSPARRRFSNVSDVVTRKISTTIGWRSVNVEAVVTQAKCLVTQYIRSRLKRAGLLNKKLGLQRLRSVANLAGGWEVCEVFPRVSCIGQELERSHPKLYSSVTRQLSITLTSDKIVRAVIVQVAGHVFRGEVNWARIISLFAVAAGLASDCVKQGHPEYVAGLIDVMGLVTERHLASWIASQGGWSSILAWSQAPEADQSVLQMLVLIVAGLILMAFLVILALKGLGQLVT